MFDLKSFRLENAISQKEIAEILKCPQGNVSKMENFKLDVKQEHVDLLRKVFGKKINPFFLDTKPSKILKAFGWVSKGEEGYDNLRNELEGLLDWIKKKTDLDISEISQRLYRKRTTILESLASSQLSPNMLHYIYKNLPKLGIKEVPNLKLISQENHLIEAPSNNLVVYKDYEELRLQRPTLLLNKLLSLDDSVDFMLVNSDNLSPIIDKNDIAIIERIAIENIVSGAYYFLAFNGGKGEWVYLKFNPTNLKWGLYSSKDGMSSGEIEESIIDAAYKITKIVKTV